jgi:ubiquinone/menaquinone biosynthesis C-methylase UbiE
MMPSATYETYGARAAFDRMAESYDAVFTRSIIGRAQRNVVWEALKRAFQPGDNILEVNCGTGEDAQFLASRGISVLACDASPGMIQIAKRRGKSDDPAASLQFRVLPNEDLHRLSNLTFDGALSNFSGLNCVADLPQVATDLGRLVKNGGTAVVCVSSRLCLWEVIWYSARTNFKKAFRRVFGATVGQLDGISVPVWYPTVRTIRQVFSPWFRLRSIRAVGLFVPPSYVEAWARKHRTMLALLERMDRMCANWPILRVLGDHVLLEFEKVGSPTAADSGRSRLGASETATV